MSEENQQIEHQNQEASSEMPKELDTWNWGAFLLTWIWGIGNQVWLALLALIPIGIVQLGVMIYLGIKGNELAWKARKYASVTEFKEIQRKWAIAGLIVFIIQMVVIAIIIALLFSLIIAATKESGTNNINSGQLTQQIGISKDLAKLSDGVATYKQVYNRMPETLNEVLIDDNMKVIVSLDGLASVPKDYQNNPIRYCLEGENFIFAYKNAQDIWQYYNPINTSNFSQKDSGKYVCK